MNETGFNTVCWHDGVIDSVYIDTKSGSEKNGYIELRSGVYNDDKSANRFKLIIRFYNVIRMSLICDFFELSDNYNPGNISNAYEYKTMSTENISPECPSADSRFSIYRFYLTEGYIEIVAGSVKIEQRKMS